MDSKQLAALCRDLADSKKGEDIAILDMRKVSTVADYFVIITGSSDPHLRAIADEITEKLKEDHDMRPRAVDGQSPTKWKVLDFVDVVVHIMHVETRKHYDIETLWGDAPRVRPRSPKKKAAPAKT